MFGGKAFRRNAAVALGSAALAVSAGASEYEDAWGPAVGTAMLPIAAADQTGAVRDLASLTGERGLLLFMVRSADW